VSRESISEVYWKSVNVSCIEGKVTIRKKMITM